MADCPFCQIQQMEPERIIRQSGLATVFMSDPRLMLGHILVAPNRHVEKPWELRADEVSEIFQEIFAVEQTLLSAGLGDGFDIRQNYRPFIKQGRLKVDHVHFHILPRRYEDELHKKAMQHEKELFKPLGSDEETKTKQLF